MATFGGNTVPHPYEAGQRAGRDEAAQRIAELEAALRGVLELDHATKELARLKRGIGTATPAGKAWLAARDAVNK